VSHDPYSTPAGKGEKRGGRRHVLIEYAILGVIAIAVALLVQAFLVKPYRIPSESMQDTLLIGDRVLVDRISWRVSEPERGDVVVFHQPETGLVLIKRVVGLPGDTLSLRDGRLVVNDSPLDEPYIMQDLSEPVPTEPFINDFDWNLQEPYTVPEGTYFMMGDNRTNSGDSREFGPVARASLVGPAFARYWPLARIGDIE
jgi:signal peptidase I